MNNEKHNEKFKFYNFVYLLNKSLSATKYNFEINSSSF